MLDRDTKTKKAQIMLNENMKKLRKSKGLSQEELDTSVSILLGETVNETNQDDLKTISEKLEVINLQLAKKSENRIKVIRISLIVLCVVIIVVFIAFAAMKGSYLKWNYTNPELAVAGTILHGAEFIFVRIAPFVLIVAVVGLVLSYKKR